MLDHGSVGGAERTSTAPPSQNKVFFFMPYLSEVPLIFCCVQRRRVILDGDESSTLPRLRKVWRGVHYRRDRGLWYGRVVYVLGNIKVRY
jgi:hypothetical protein